MANSRQKLRLLTCRLLGIFYTSRATTSAGSDNLIVLSLNPDVAPAAECELAAIFATACSD